MFKQIEGYPKYSINEKGEVKSSISGKILKPRTAGKGYLCYNLYGENGPSNKYIHRLVAKAFLPNPNNLPFVDHIDGDKQNNHLSNLRWTTNYQNLKYYGFDKLKRHSIEGVGVGVMAVNGDVTLKFETKSDLLRHFGYKTNQTRVKIGEPYSHGKLKGFTIYHL